jgi:N6-L-threonylcarbamoyladenine synthase
MAYALGIPMIDANHMQAHVLAHFIKDNQSRPIPSLPFLCLTVSGGHTQIVLVDSPYSMKVIGETIDDAAGEAFDKAAKVLGLPYPGGPLVDKLAREGNPLAFSFPIPQIPGLNYSFSGLKTSFLYLLRDKQLEDQEFTAKRMNDLCASMQYTIVKILLLKFKKAIDETGVKDIALAGGVSANSALRKAFLELAENQGITAHIPPFEYCTDNAAMIGISAWFKYQNKDFAGLNAAPIARWSPETAVNQ